VHVEAVAFFDVASEDQDDEGLRQFAVDMLPVLREHLETAEGIEDITEDLYGRIPI
jgi:predicted outer membrane protein